MSRPVADLEAGQFDVVVIGGGVVGACAAWDAARRGLSVALVERGDFGGGASSNSLKIVHGGLRHLQQLAFGRVRESNRERAVWLRVAPHLVEPLPVLVPAYGRGRRGRAALRAGVAAADLLARGLNAELPAGRRIPPGRAIGRRECVDLAPELESADLSGGVLFHDASMYSSERLTLSVLLGARHAGAVVSNYVEAMGPLRTGSGLAGVTASDRLNGRRFEIRARVIVNAAGAAAEAVARRLVPQPAAFPPLSVAVNLVFPSLGHEVAFALPLRATGPGRPSPDRFLFVVPWRGLTMVGTGHYPADVEGSTGPGAEVERFHEEVRNAFPRDRSGLERPLVVHRGWLPVAPPAGSYPVRPLRRARIVDHARDGAPGVLSVISVKYTTARLAAEEAIDAVFDQLDHPRKPGDTAVAPLPGAADQSMEELHRSARARAGDLVPPDVLEHLVRAYGTDYERVLGHRTDIANWDERVVAGAPVIVAQLVHGVRHEMACTVEDLLDRRTELGARGLVTAAARELAAGLLGRFGGGAAPGRSD